MSNIDLRRANAAAGRTSAGRTLYWKMTNILGVSGHWRERSATEARTFRNYIALIQKYRGDFHAT